MDANPFAAPATDAERTPVRTTGTLWSMTSSFRVGRHRVQVETGHWSGVEVYRVDGEERARKRNLGWHAHQTLDVGRHRVEVRSRWYPVLPVVVEVDGKRVIDDLFPQVRGLTRAIGVSALAVMGAMGAATLWDVVRWLGWVDPGASLL